MAQREDHITEQIVANGFTPPIEEPIDRDYVYIAKKIADRLIPLHPAEDGYEHRGEESVMAMARLHIYWHIVEELDSCPKIARHLRTTDGVTDALGLDSPRSRETIRLSWKQQFDGLHGRLRELAKNIRAGIGWGMDGVLMAMGVDDWSQSFPEFTEEGIRKAAKDRAYERIRPILTDIVDFDRADNVSVPSEDLTDYAGWLARRREMYPESMDSYVAEMDHLEDEPFDPETYRRAVRNKERERVVVDDEVHWVKPRAFVDETTPNPDVYDSWDDLATDDIDWSVDLLDDPGGTDDWHSTTEEGIERFVAELTEDGIIDDPVPVCIDGSIRSWHKHPRGRFRIWPRFQLLVSTNAIEGGNWRLKYGLSVPYARCRGARARTSLLALRDSMTTFANGEPAESFAHRHGSFSFEQVLGETSPRSLPQQEDEQVAQAAA